jgi:hypothetical protein
MCLLLFLTVQCSAAWLAVGPIRDGHVEMFKLGDDGKKGASVLTIPVTPGEVLDSNSFTCGRCFCLMLTTDVTTQSSFLYNASFCLVDKPALESKVKVPFVATNLHCNLGEGDGGNGYSVRENKEAREWSIVQFVGEQSVDLVNITSYVAQYGPDGGIYPGGTAYCANSNTMWVAIESASRDTDTLLTVDLTSKEVKSVSWRMPLLPGHFANCKSQIPGGIMLQSGPGGKKNVIIGELSTIGALNPLDSLALPAGSKLDVTPIVDVIATPLFSSEYGAILKDPTNPNEAGSLFVSKGVPGSAKLLPLGTMVTALAVAF